MFKNTKKKDLIIVAEAIGEVVPEKTNIVKLKQIIENSQAAKDDLEFVKDIIISTVEEREKIEAEGTRKNRRPNDRVKEAEKRGYLSDEKLKDHVINLISNYSPNKIRTTDLQMSIILTDDIPVTSPVRRLAPIEKQQVTKQIEEWLAQGIIEKSYSDYASPIVLVKREDALTSAPVLAYPEIGKQFILDTDESHECIGAVLSHEIDGQKRVIAYFKGQIARWIQRLQEYDMEIRHRKGSAHGNADALSRRPCSENCNYCSRVEKKFGMENPVIRQVTTPSTSESDPWNDESVQKDQLADPEIKPIIEFKESTGGKPSWQDIAPFPPTTKRYWALWDSHHLRNGVLYRKWESDDGKAFRWQLILPKARVSTVLKEFHGSPTGGHFGVTKTLQKVRERFYWNNVRNDVEKWCRTCDPCVARKGPGKRIKGRLQLYNVGVPFERIAFDILGPLPRSSDGNNNILVLMDYFTKWPEANPIPDQEAPTVAEILVQNRISRYGVPL
ncbi:Transposon Ty3-G Gag-Pol polyprotein like [Argiope bruennichi]|uniref:RNA-directed DNA polymerase n=1 Tax=Argiope bruennichi TaxID=94029 RepID=A0A8T0FIT0_ARGBR|nr:Transposon Ty3-G Gag-Pol polyprotein like [Argiope bruennichi]